MRREGDRIIRETPVLTDTEYDALRNLGIDYGKAQDAFESLNFAEYVLGCRVSGLRLLDVGCGSSPFGNAYNAVRPPAFLLLLTLRGARAFGVDPGDQDDLHTNHIRKNGGDIWKHTLMTFSGELEKSRSILGGGFDVVITTDTFGRNPDPQFNIRYLEDREDLEKQRTEFLTVSGRVLKGGGIALCDWEIGSQECDGRHRYKYHSWQKPEEPQRPSLLGRIFGRK